MKRTATIAMVLCLALGAATMAAAAQAPGNGTELKRQMREFERVLTERLTQAFDARPFVVLQEPKAVHLTGYGLLIHTEVNLYPTAPLMPFAIAPADLERQHKVEREQRVVRLKDLTARMRDLLAEQGAAMSQLRGDEKVALVIHLFAPRAMTGLPTQLILYATRQELADLQAGGRKPDAAALARVIPIQEF